MQEAQYFSFCWQLVRASVPAEVGPSSCHMPIYSWRQRRRPLDWRWWRATETWFGQGESQ